MSCCLAHPHNILCTQYISPPFFGFATCFQRRWGVDILREIPRLLEIEELLLEVNNLSGICIQCML